MTRLSLARLVPCLAHLKRQPPPKGGWLSQTVDKTVRDIMSANRFFAHFQFSNLNFMLEKKNCNDEERYFAPHFIRHFQIASFFRFMQPNKRFSSIFILARPLYCVYLIPCFSFASAKTLSIVSLCFLYRSFIPIV